MVRQYSSTAVQTELSAGVTGSDVSITVASVSGFPLSFPYTLAIDPDNGSKELVEVTAAVGTTLTVTRGVDGTSGVSHSLGAVVRHDHSARDFREPQEHIAATSDVHGVSGDLVGATQSQALTNKDLTSGTNTFPGTLATTVNLDAVADDLANHLADAADAHDASAISFSPAGSIAATNAQAAIEEVSGDIDAHVADGTDAHDASAISFSPTGTIASTNVQAAVAEVATEAASALAAAVPTGTILMGGWADGSQNGTVPTGFLRCDGSAVSRATYAALFAAIGTAFGAGDGSTTFNLPNLNSRFPRGTDSSGTDLGDTGGAATHTHNLSNSGWAKVYAPQSNDAIYFDYVGTSNWTSDFVHTATGDLVFASANSFGFGVGLDGATDSGSTLPPYQNIGYVIKF